MKKIRFILGCSFSAIVLFSALAFGCLTFLSNRGMPEAQVFLGYLYQGSQNVFTKNKIKAQDYFLRAAKQGSVEGQCALGELYQSQHEYQKAAYWYLQSAFKGSHRCQINFMSLNFSDEVGVFQMLKGKADENISFAEYLVGKRLIEGVGTKKNIHEGLIYLKKAANHNSEVAKIYLSGLYIKGKVVKKDYDQASEFLNSIEN